MEYFQSMQTMTFNNILRYSLSFIRDTLSQGGGSLAIFILLSSMVFSITVTPENYSKYQGYTLESVIVSPSIIQGINFKERLNYLMPSKQFYANYLLNDISTLLETGRLEDVHIVIKPLKGRRLNLELKLIENPKIRYVDLQNFTLPDKNILLKQLQNRANTPVNFNVVSPDISTIETHYKKSGFVLAKVSDVVFIRSLQSLIYTIDEGIIE